MNDELKLFITFLKRHNVYHIYRIIFRNAHNNTTNWFEKMNEAQPCNYLMHSFYWGLEPSISWAILNNEWNKTLTTFYEYRK